MPTIRETNEALLRRAQGGDRCAEDDLIRLNLRLAHSVARKFIRRAHNALEYEDLVSEALIGMLKAARSFDPTAGFAFSTLAVVVMERHCQRAIMAADVVKRPVCAQVAGVEPLVVLSLDYAGEDGEDRLADLLPASDDTEAEAIGGAWTAAAIRSLPARERMAVGLSVIEEWPLRDVGRVLGLSGEGARRLVKRALGRLQEAAASPLTSAPPAGPPASRVPLPLRVPTGRSQAATGSGCRSSAATAPPSPVPRQVTARRAPAASS